VWVGVVSLPYLISFLPYLISLFFFELEIGSLAYFFRFFFLRGAGWFVLPYLIFFCRIFFPDWIGSETGTLP
jgi:hypothetical protein